MPQELVLAADIGGTNIRLVLIRDGQRIYPNNETEGRYLTTEHPKLLSAINDFLSQTELRPTKCCLAIAGVVSNGQVTLTNMEPPQTYDEIELSKALGVEVLIINDFAAVGYYIRDAAAGDSEKVVLQQGVPSEGTTVYTGTGTGLGVGMVVGKTVLSSEGGHMALRCNNKFEDEFREYMKQKFSNEIKRVSTERAVCGPGICNIADFMKTYHPASQSTKYQTGQTAVEIFEQAVAGDEFCYDVIKQYYHEYGGAISDFAIMSLPSKIYIVGTMTNEHLDFLFAHPDVKDAFLSEYLNAGRLAPTLQKAEISVLTNRDLALYGCYHCVINGK